MTTEYEPLDLDTWLSALEAAQLVGVTAKTIFLHMRAGRLRWEIRNGRQETQWRDLLDWLARKQAYEAALSAYLAGSTSRTARSSTGATTTPVPTT